MPQFALGLCYLWVSFGWINKAFSEINIETVASGLGNEEGALSLSYLHGEHYEQFNDIDIRGPAYNLAEHQWISMRRRGIKTNDNQAYLWLRKTAEQNHGVANFFLGICYQGGIGTQKNNELAFTCFKMATEQDCRNAYYLLAHCYREGKGCQQNDLLAFEWFKNAAEQGIFNAQWYLACCYFYGKGVEKNTIIAIEGFTKVAEQVNHFFLNPSMVAVAAEACLLLGELYDQGNIVEKNKELAIKWNEKGEKGIFSNYHYKEDREKDSAKHQLEFTEAWSKVYCCLAEFYLKDKSTAQDFILGMEYRLKAIETGHTFTKDLPEDEYQLALIYFDGKGVDKNNELGMKWMIIAAAHGHAEAYQSLEETYLNFVFPYFVERADIVQCYKFAFEWLLNGHKDNPEDFEINFGLGTLYAFGKGIEKNQGLAVKHFTACMDECNNVYGIAFDEEFLSMFHDFSDLYCDISKGNIKGYYFDRLAPFFLEEKVKDAKQSNAVLSLLRIDFHLQMYEFELIKEFLNNFEDLDSTFSYPSSKKNFKLMSLTATKQAKELEEKNKQLQASQIELEDMMSMFAHKFRSPLDAIIYNTQHENQVALYTEAAQTMRGLLNIFSIISTDADILKDKIKQDYQGSGQLEAVFSKTLDMILLHLLSVSGAEKIQQHYLSYAKTHDQCAELVSYKTWCEEYFELEQVLQSAWEASYAQLLSQSATLEQRLAWLEEHFFKLELIGFERADIQFKEYGVTESLLTILLNEILVNAFKYYSSASKQPVILEWIEREGYQVLLCRNPSIRSERTIIKGSHKGHVFLSTLARKTGSLFNKPIPQDNFIVEFGIPNELLISK